MATSDSQENGSFLDQSIPQWKRELILRRRALARTLPAGNTSVKLTCPSVVTAVKHPELAVAAGENISGKQQRCILSSVASNKGVLDQIQADFHPRGRSSDSSSASTISSPPVVGNMRLVERQLEGDADLMINGVGFDIMVDQNSGKYRSGMGEEKFVKRCSPSSRNIVDNSVVNMTKSRLMIIENNNCHQYEEEECESDSSEELQYGPGIVNKLKCRYMSMTLRKNLNKGVRPSLSNMRRATSLENMLDSDTSTDTGKPQITQHRFAKKVDAANSIKPEHCSPHQQRYRPTSRRNDSMKRARSVETLLRYDRSHTATGHSIPSDLPVCEKISKTRDCNKNNKVLKCLGNEEIVIVENKMKADCIQKAANEEMVPTFQQKKRSSFPEETELPPPDVVKQTLKIFEGTPTRKATRLTRAHGVSTNAALLKNNGLPVTVVNSSGNDIKGPLRKPVISPKPVLTPEKSPRKLPPPPPGPADNLQNISSNTPNRRIVGLETLGLSAGVSPIGTTRLKSPSPTNRRPVVSAPITQPEEHVNTSISNGKITVQELVADEEEILSSDDDLIDGMAGTTKEVPRSALDNIRKDGTSLEFKFNNNASNTKPKTYLPVSRGYNNKQNSTGTGTTPVEMQEIVGKSVLTSPITKSPDSPQTQVKQVCVIRPIVNNAHPNSPPPSLTDREIEKNFINRSKCIEQPTSKVVVSLKEPDSVVVGKVSLESLKGISGDSAKSVKDTVVLRNSPELKSSGLWDTGIKPWNQPENSMHFNFTNRKGPPPPHIEDDGIRRRRNVRPVSVTNMQQTSTHPNGDLYQPGPSSIRPQNISPMSVDTMRTSSVQPTTSHPRHSGQHLQNPESIHQLRPSVIMHTRDIPQAAEGRKINVDGTTDESSTDVDIDDGTLACGSPPSPCNVLFEGDNILINGKSNLLKQPKQHKLRIKFNDAATTTFEYPSEASLLHDNLSPSSTTTGPSPSLSSSGLTPGVPVPLGGSSLASYTPSKVHLGSEDFQLGVTRAAPLLPSHTSENVSNQKEEEEEVEYLKPAEDSETIAWSSETASDLLF